MKKKKKIYSEHKMTSILIIKKNVKKKYREKEKQVIKNRILI